jgi:hypothetical protein
VNLFSGTSWLWKALRGNSVTFAALFCLGILGLSVTRLLKNALGALGVPWLGLLIVPILIIGLVAKKEREWIPEEEARKRWSRRLVFGSIAVSVLLALVGPEPARDPAGSQPGGANPPVRHRGPPGK